ncbi:hypothetical protein HDA32_006024 [Spinactinospora alkalitolerans]|uniref:Pyridoxamine 5'-phosphate oxidase putative domain-containing protein n=1 Tax=Spinactinospora alkalitolerans TaxID=687207 RepID=A0A852U9W7_9ACTN|nr:PPOX class F420-dependent oxidoreductase [Spinactinospora alkalitolerans]NYE50904.1 hypothetical protein [Spinactinospora alkalitolerans]
MSAATILKTFHREKTALLTTYHQDGMTAVDTPVRIAVDGDRVLFRAWEDSGEAERLRRHPVADLRPCTFRGDPNGLPVRGGVKPLEGGEAQRAARMLSRRHPVLQGWAVPLSHRLVRRRTLYYELCPRDDAEIESNEGCPD